MKAKRPTESELAILQVLWRRGPSTVREVFDALKAKKPMGYTTVLKILQIMLEKGLVTRDEKQRSHCYLAAADPAVTRAQLVDDLIDRAFDGSPLALMQSVLASGKTSPDDLAKIRAALDDRRKKC